jgi:hypothetical protein
MRIIRRLLGAGLLASLGGCGNSVPTSPAPPAPPSPPLPESFEVSGTLFETVDGVARPRAGGQVRLLNFISVEPCGRFGCGQIEREETYYTDDNGHYTARVKPASRVFVYARDFSGLQPCLASAVVDKDTTIDVHVVPAGSPLTPPAAASPLITGFVYETTSQGRKPLQGLGVGLEVGERFSVANTQTDEAGHFFLCRVNAFVAMFVSSFEEWFRPIPGTADAHFEIELTR